MPGVTRGAEEKPSQSSLQLFYVWYFPYFLYVFLQHISWFILFVNSNWYVCESWCCGFFLLVVVVPSILPQPPCLVVDSLAAWWPVCPCCLPACDPLSISYNLLYCVFSSFLASFLLVISRASSNFFLNWHLTMWWMWGGLLIIQSGRENKSQKSFIDQPFVLINSF